MAEMMDEVRPEMKVMLDEVKRIAQEHWLPYVDEFDALGGAQVKVRRQKEWLNFWNAFKDAGFFGFRIPKEYGGIGFGVGDFFMVVRDAGRYGLSGSFSNYFCCMQSNYLAPLYLEDEATRIKYYKKGLDGAIVGFAGTEPGCGNEYGAIKCTGVRQDDNYVLNGQKWFCGNVDTGPFGLNFTQVFVKTDPTKRLKGVSQFLVDNDNPGFVLGREGDPVGMRVFPRWEVSLKDCVVPVVNRVGKEGGGGYTNIKQMNEGYVGVAAQAVGIALGCLDYTLDYTKNRVVFGSPISDYQGIHYVLADMAVGCEAGDIMGYKAALAHDADSPDAGKISVQAKLFTSDMVLDVTTKAMKIFAGRAYERGEGHPIERLWRDSIMWQLLRTGNLDRRGVAQWALGKKLKAGFEY